MIGKEKRKNADKNDMYGWLCDRKSSVQKIDSTVDFTKIYNFLKDLYCSDNGKPVKDPVVLFKIVSIQNQYTI